MKRILIACFLMVSDITYCSEVVINKIFFNGCKRISLDAVFFNLPLKIGSIINHEDIVSSIKILFYTGFFEQIVISSDETGVVIIQVKERPIINAINLNGNTIIKADEINKILHAKKIQSGEPFNECSIFELQQELELLYRSLGKFTAIVKMVVVPLSRNRVDLKIMFTEGKSAKLRQINIFGNNAFHAKKLLSQFKLCRTTKWWNVLSNKQYQQQGLLHDLEMLRNFYFNHGYAKFHIHETQFDLTPDKKNIYLSLYITEGAQYSFDSLILRGNMLDVFPNIKKYIKISPGELFSNNKIQEIEYNIRHILSKHGYIKPIVLIESDINDDSKTVKLYIYVDVGHNFYVREIRFKGNDTTKDEVMRREIHHTEQIQLDYVRVIQDQKRLERLGYFSSVNTNIEYVPNTFNKVDVIYSVKERNTGNLNLSVGVGSESGTNLQLGIHQENVLGSGNSVFISGIKSNYQTYTEISVTKPYYNTNPVKISGRLFFNNLNTNNTILSNYNLKDYGININCSYPLIEYSKFDIGLNYIVNYLNNVIPQVTILRYLESVGIYSKTIKHDDSLNTTIDFHTNDLLLLLGWNFNDLNHAYFPTYGSYINVCGTLTLPESSNRYYKITMNGSNYVSLDKYCYWTLMNTIHFGYAGNINKKEHPFYDNFYLGGIGTVRGFRINSIGPKSAYYRCNYSDKNYTTCSIENSQDIIGGNAMILLKTELIVPIAYLDMRYPDVMRVALFLDAGTVWDTCWKNTEATRSAGIMDYSIPSNIRISSGITLKWISPIGPVIFSYSKLIRKYTGDITEPFQFSIGKIW